MALRRVRVQVGFDATYPQDSQNLKVAVRCIDGPIFVGDNFQKLWRDGSASSIDLTVEKIVAYHRIFDQLDPSVTAELTISGPDLPAIKKGDDLIGEV